MACAADSRRGFTLTELIIVISVIAILAAIVLPRFNNFRDQAEATAAGTSMVSIAKALQHYRVTHDDWPADKNRRQLPPEIKAYLPNDDFTTGPIGGVWDYEDWRNQSHNAGGEEVGIAISIVEGNPALYEAIDREIDDGNLATGTVRYCESMPRLVYILELK